MALSDYALTTLEDVKQHLGITAADQDVLLEQLINAATETIERYCARKFAARNFIERTDGKTCSRIVVKNPPIIQVNKVAYGSGQALSASFTGTAIESTIQVTASGIILRSTVAAGTTTSSTLAFTTYPTVSTIVAAIAAVSGWTATTITEGISNELNPLAGQPCLNTTVYLTYPDQASAVKWVDYDAGIIALTEFDDARWYPPEMQGGYFPHGMNHVMVNYRGGYESVSSAAATGGLARAARDLVKLQFTRSQGAPEARAEHDHIMQQVNPWRDIALGVR